jgi:hypothetical protein
MYVSALEFFQQKTFDSNHPIIITAFRYDLACTLFAQDDLEGAERELSKALAIKEMQVLGSHDEESSWEVLGPILEELGKSIKAAKEVKKVESKESRPLPLGGDFREVLQVILFPEGPLSTLTRSRCSFPESLSRNTN